MHYVPQTQDGKAIKTLATASRLDIEDFLQKKVYLEVITSSFFCRMITPSAIVVEQFLITTYYCLEQIDVKVKENWRQDERLLKRYGYGGEIRALYIHA